MKLTAQRLRSLVKQVIKENKMVLVEAKIDMDYDSVMNILRGNTDVKTVGIMSGQNPMAQSMKGKKGARKNRALARQLKSMVTDEGLEAVEVKGVFKGIDEESLIIFNPTMEQMRDLNLQFRQWGFVFGENTGENMIFTMQKMNVPSGDPEIADMEKSYYEGGYLGSSVPSDSNPAAEIHTDTTNPKGAGRPDNITLVDGKPIVIPLYKGYGDPDMSQLTGEDEFYATTPKKTRMKENKKLRVKRRK
jgi:hypothetical protein